MKITQDLVTRIVEQARESDFGLSPGLTHKNGHLELATYGNPPDLQTLAMLLVNGWDGKYDLISVFAAALQIVAEESARPISDRQALALRGAAEDFVAKVERGEARSVRSYKQFKDALAVT